MTFLIGYMAAGKSTLVEMLRAVHGWPVADTDALLEEHYGMTCGEMIRRYGMEEFRRREAAGLDRMSRLSSGTGSGQMVVATGGGLPCWRDNLERMKQMGRVVYLRWSPEMLTMRLFLTDREKRPLIAGMDREQTLQYVREQLREREHWYLQADRVMECDELSDYGIYRLFSLEFRV